MRVEQQQVGAYYQLKLFEDWVPRSHSDTGNGGTGAETHEEHQTLTASNERRALAQHLMEKVCNLANRNRAYKSVKANKGSAGIDGITSKDLREWLRTHRIEL